MGKIIVEGNMVPIEIMNYAGRKAVIEIPKLSMIEDFDVSVVSGDEIFSISTKFGAGTCGSWDAAKELNGKRKVSFFDGDYTLIRDGVIDSDAMVKFFSRKNTYEMIRYFDNRINDD